MELQALNGPSFPLTIGRQRRAKLTPRNRPKAQRRIDLRGVVAIIWSAVVTGIIAFALEKTIGWRVTEAQEVGGIDLADQGERAYDFAGTASSVLKEVK